MGSIDKKLNVLRQIAEVFNEKQITWAIGASMLLYFKGLADDFHDIDIMAAEKDVAVIKDILLPMGEMMSPGPDVQYATKHFMEFRVEGIDIDVIAGFTIIKGDEEHYFPLKEEQILDYTEIGGIKIPLHSLEEWRLYYELMGRTEKVKMIDSH